MGERYGFTIRARDRKIVATYAQRELRFLSIKRFLSMALLPFLLAFSTAANAIVIRHDVEDARYKVPATHFPALVDLPSEGHGVLIASRWVLTAAHATHCHSCDMSINGRSRQVARVVVHPGYRTISPELYAGHSGPAMRAQAERDDIALIQLAEPVADVTPAVIYRGSDEVGQLVQLLGKGATGNGVDGVPRHAPHRSELRRAFNVVASADARWLGYVFDGDASAQAMEGMMGSGDSGGPMLIEVDGRWQVAGLAAWAHWLGDMADYREGVYGMQGRYVRVSRYADWIDGVLAGNGTR